MDSLQKNMKSFGKFWANVWQLSSETVILNEENLKKRLFVLLFFIECYTLFAVIKYCQMT